MTKPSREELVYTYSQLTDEALLRHLQGGTLSGLAVDVVREELQRRGVDPASEVATAVREPGQDLTRRGTVLRRMTVAFLAVLVTVNVLIGALIYQAIRARHPHMPAEDINLVTGTLAYALVAASVLSLIAGAVLGLVIRTRWTWRLVSLSYFALYLGALCLMLPAALEDIAPYF